MCYFYLELSSTMDDLYNRKLIFYQSFKECRKKLSYSEGIHYFFHTINVHKNLLLKKGFLSTLSEMNRFITKSSFKDFDKRRYICLQC
jgi:hypothetical protein